MSKVRQYKKRQVDRQTGRQIDKQTDIQIDMQTCRQKTDIQIDKQTDIEINRYTYGKNTDIQTNIQIYKQTEIEIDRLESKYAEKKIDRQMIILGKFVKKGQFNNFSANEFGILSFEKPVVGHDKLGAADHSSVDQDARFEPILSIFGTESY